jgi:hypothetical protein
MTLWQRSLIEASPYGGSGNSCDIRSRADYGSVSTLDLQVSIGCNEVRHRLKSCSHLAGRDDEDSISGALVVEGVALL